MEFGEKLRTLRKERNLSQQELADGVFVSRSSIAKWENGLGLPGNDSLKLLCDFFDVTEKDLLEESASNNVLKNRKVFRYKKGIIIISVIAAVFLVTSIVLGVININRHKKTSEIPMLYYEKPLMRLDGLKPDYYSVGCEFEEVNGEYVWKTYANLLPTAEVCSSLSTIEYKDYFYIDLPLPCEYFIKYYFLDENYEFIDGTSGWTNSPRPFKPKEVDEINSVVVFDFVRSEGKYILLSFNCNYKDLGITYYYLVANK